MEDDLTSGLADIVPVGRFALANPDFVDRYRNGEPLNAVDPTTFYTGAAKGYVDYPRFLDRASGATPKSP